MQNGGGLWLSAKVKYLHEVNLAIACCRSNSRRKSCLPKRAPKGSAEVRSGASFTGYISLEVGENPNLSSSVRGKRTIPCELMPSSPREGIVCETDLIAMRQCALLCPSLYLKQSSDPPTPHRC